MVQVVVVVVAYLLIGYPQLGEDAVDHGRWKKLIKI